MAPLMRALVLTAMLAVAGIAAFPVGAQPLPLLPHPPISISSDADFLLPSSGVVAGTGTEADPYVIKGWEIDSSNPNPLQQSEAIDIRGTTKHFVLQNLNVKGAFNALYLSGNANGILHNITFEVTGGGLRVENSPLVISDVRIVSGSSSTIDHAPVARLTNVHLEGNDQHFGFGLLGISNTQTVHLRSVSIRDPFGAGAAINLSGNRDVLLEDSTLVGPFDYVLQGGGNGNITLSASLFETEGGLYKNGGLAAIRLQAASLVLQDVVARSGRIGLESENAGTVLVKSSEIHGDQNAISFEGSQFIAVDSELQSKASHALTFDGRGEGTMQLTRIRIPASGLSAISARDGRDLFATEMRLEAQPGGGLYAFQIDRVRLENVSFDNNGYESIAQNGCDIRQAAEVHLVDVQSTRNNGTGLHIEAQRLTANGVHVQDNAKDGFYASVDELEVDNLTATGNRAGFWVQARTGTLRNATLSNNSAVGVDYHSYESATITGLLADGNGQLGAQWGGYGIRVVAATLVRSGGPGARLEGEGHLIDASSFSFNKGHGITSFYQLRNTTIERSTFESNEGSGLAVAFEPPRNSFGIIVRDNLFKGNRLFGVEMQPQANTVTGNTFVENAKGDTSPAGIQSQGGMRGAPAPLEEVFVALLLGKYLHRTRGRRQ